MQYSWPNHLLDLHMHHEEIEKLILFITSFLLLGLILCSIVGPLKQLLKQYFIILKQHSLS